MGGGKDKTVIVTDKDWAFLKNTRPGKARILVKKGEASFVTKKPPMIQLNKTVSTDGGTKMITINDYFKNSDGDVFIQNISGGIVSLTFYHTDGRVEPFTLPNDRRPICLTNRIPIEMVQRSTDIRRLIQRRPPAIKLLTAEEYSKAVELISKESGKTIEQVVDDAEDKLTKAQTKIATQESIKEDEKETVDTDVMESKAPRINDIDIPGVVEDEVDPKVLQIIAASSPESGNRADATFTIEQLALMNLKETDFEYIIGNASWKKVIAWAQKKKKEIKKEETSS